MNWCHPEDPTPGAYCERHRHWHPADGRCHHCDGDDYDALIARGCTHDEAAEALGLSLDAATYAADDDEDARLP